MTSFWWLFLQIWLVLRLVWIWWLLCWLKFNSKIIISWLLYSFFWASFIWILRILWILISLLFFYKNISFSKFIFIRQILVFLIKLGWTLSLRLLYIILCLTPLFRIITLNYFLLTTSTNRYNINFFFTWRFLA